MAFDSANLLIFNSFVFLSKVAKLNLASGGGGDCNEQRSPKSNEKEYFVNKENAVDTMIETGVNDFDARDESRQSDDYAPIDEIPAGRKYLAVFVLFLINLLNYMDRYTVAG